MQRESENFHILVGAVATILVAAYLIYGYASDRPGQVSGAGYTVHARFQSIDGISDGSEVLLAGLPIGTVTADTFDTSTNSAIVSMRIRDDIELPIDSIALILSRGMMGGKYIKIEPGGDLDTFADGDEFEYVQNSVILGELLEKVIVAAEANRRRQNAEAAASESENQ